ncbi:hypothetical protein [Aeromicrobium alkaliterrae]|uniref:Uncharacterized protein n=1 Tax=Aeromicrobium alkaliterrae TaxID=302168 RepID=A0ABN2JR23_9ACTN
MSRSAHRGSPSRGHVAPAEAVPRRAPTRRAPSRLPPALWTVALVAVMAVAAQVDPVLVAATVLLVQAQIAVGPHPTDPRGRTVRAPKVAAVMTASLVATALTLWPRTLVGADGTTAGDIADVVPGSLVAIVPATAAGLVVALISQMFRRDGRRELVTTTAHAATASLLAALAIGWITAARNPLGEETVVLGAVGVGVGVLLWCLPGDRYVVASVAMAGSAVACALVAQLAGDFFTFTWVFGLVMGAQVSIGAVLGQVVGRAWGEGRRHAASGWGFPGAMSVALAAPLVHLIGQLGVG